MSTGLGKKSRQPESVRCNHFVFPMADRRRLEDILRNTDWPESLDASKKNLFPLNELLYTLLVKDIV